MAAKKTTKPAKAAKKAAKPRKKAAPKRPPGRPTDYSPKLAARICERMAQGESVRSICRDEDMPALSSVYVWLTKHPEFVEQYTRAKTDSAEAMAEEMLEIADRTDRDFTLDPETMTLRVDGEHIQRARLMVDTRKWLLSKLAPKKYGDKVDVNHGSQPDNPLSVLLEQVAGTGMKPKPNPARS